MLASNAIAVMNVVLSSLSKRRWPGRAGLLIGIYLTALSLGAVTGSLLSVPLYQASGGSVRLGLGWIALPAALATLLWLPQARHTIRAVVPARARSVAVYRYALAWQVTAFMGLQSLLYFATLSWLPTIFRGRGATPEVEQDSPPSAGPSTRASRARRRPTRAATRTARARDGRWARSPRSCGTRGTRAVRCGTGSGPTATWSMLAT